MAAGASRGRRWSTQPAPILTQAVGHDPRRCAARRLVILVERVLVAIQRHDWEQAVTRRTSYKQMAAFALARASRFHHPPEAGAGLATFSAETPRTTR